MYQFLSPSQKQKTLLKKKIEDINGKIDRMIEENKTSDLKYQNLIKLHYSFYRELQKI